MRIENPHIDEGALKPATPDATCRNVETGLLSLDSGAILELLPSDRLQVGLHGDIVSHSLQHMGSEVTHPHCAAPTETPLWGKTKRERLKMWLHSCKMMAVAVEASRSASGFRRGTHPW